MSPPPTAESEAPAVQAATAILVYIQDKDIPNIISVNDIKASDGRTSYGRYVDKLAMDFQVKQPSISWVRTQYTHKTAAKPFTINSQDQLEEALHSADNPFLVLHCVEDIKPSGKRSDKHPISTGEQVSNKKGDNGSRAVDSVMSESPGVAHEDHAKKPEEKASPDVGTQAIQAHGTAAPEYSDGKLNNGSPDLGEFILNEERKLDLISVRMSLMSDPDKAKRPDIVLGVKAKLSLKPTLQQVRIKAGDVKGQDIETALARTVVRILDLMDPTEGKLEIASSDIPLDVNLVLPIFPVKGRYTEAWAPEELLLAVMRAEPISSTRYFDHRAGQFLGQPQKYRDELTKSLREQAMQSESKSVICHDQQGVPLFFLPPAPKDGGSWQTIHCFLNISRVHFLAAEIRIEAGSVEVLLYDPAPVSRSLTAYDDVKALQWFSEAKRSMVSYLNAAVFRDGCPLPRINFNGATFKKAIGPKQDTSKNIDCGFLCLYWIVGRVNDRDFSGPRDGDKALFGLKVRLALACRLNRIGNAAKEGVPVEGPTLYELFQQL